MKHFLTTLSIGLICLAPLAQAQESTKHAAALALVQSPAYAPDINLLMTEHVQFVFVDTLHSEVPRAEKKRIAKILAAEMRELRPEWERLLAETITKRFTLEEIELLNKTFAHPAAPSALAKLKAAPSHFRQQNPEFYSSMHARKKAIIARELAE